MPRSRLRQPLRARAWQAARRHPLWASVAIVLLLFAVWVGYLNWLVTDRFEGRRWDVPARVYAQPLELYAGRELSAAGLQRELARLGYREVARWPQRPGTFRRQPGRIEARTRQFRFWDELQPSLELDIRFVGQRIAGIRDAHGERAIVRLDPLPVGSIFPQHGEDRIVVTPEQVPELLREALKAVEDRRFESHFGVDLRAVGRALLANIRAGAVEQGGSTLTQQLVKNYFLDNRQTLWRKIREALMAVLLELHYEKDDLMNAYINEIYLGQDGNRAIHGFGLASRFYFSRPLDELELHELALLVALVRGPGYYDPLKHPERAEARRELVLDVMASEGIVDEDEARRAAAAELGIWDRKAAGASYYPAYLKLVREQLAAHYDADDLTRTGLRVFTALDPLVQASAERRVAEGLDELDVDDTADLAGAAVVTSTQSGEVLAAVGDRRAGYEGFNRAVDARRPVGSLLKPVVYLAALETGRYTMASIVEDARVEVELDNGDTWTPQNFNDEELGEVTLLRALTESLNMATVRLGLDTGVENIVSLLESLGFEGVPPYPSLILGAIEMSPLEVADLYGTFANGGFRTPLRAVRSVVDAGGEPLDRYPIEVSQVADPASVYQLNQALVEVMRRGTGRSAELSDGLVAAGKTGTSDEFRDSWFAGFTGDRVAVVWIGYDDYRPTGLSGASGALRIWDDLMRDVAAVPYTATPPDGLEARWVDYDSGAVVGRRCGNAVELGIPEEVELPRGSCGILGIGKRTLDWLNDIVN